jgi:hypothetical protein
MKLEEIYSDIKKDFIIDETNMANEALRTSQLFIKYVQIFTNEKLRLEQLDNRKKLLLAEKREYYYGNAAPEVYKEKPFDVKVKTEVVLQKYLDNDSDIVKYNENIIIQQEKVNVLKMCLDEIKNRNYQIKNYIEYTKFISGG